MNRLACLDGLRGVLAAYVLSIVNTLRGDGHVYYEVGCVILVLVTLGRWLEQKGFEGEFDVQRRAEEVPVTEYLKLVAELPRN